MTFGDRLRFFRDALGISQAELAFRAGLAGQSTVGNYEANIRRPNFDELLKLAEVLEVPVGPLIDPAEFAQLSNQREYALLQARVLRRLNLADERGRYIIDQATKAAVEPPGTGQLAPPGEAA